MFAHTVVLPGLRLAGHELHFFCDLTRPNALDELLATCDTWLDLLAEEPPSSLTDEDSCYDWAQRKMRATLLAVQQAPARQRVLDRVFSDFLGKHAFPEVQAALSEYYHADIEQFKSQPSTTRSVH